MRAILASLILTVLPGIAFAQQCACNCVGGRAVAVCPADAITQPICQKLCIDGVGQTLSMPSVSPPNLGGRLGAEAGGTSPQDALASGNLEGLLNQ